MLCIICTFCIFLLYKTVFQSSHIQQLNMCATVVTFLVCIVAISNALSECYDANEFGIDSMDGVLKVNGTRFNLKAAAWYESSKYIYPCTYFIYFVLNIIKGLALRLITIAFMDYGL